MATSSKFDATSCSPDRPLYTGQRGSHIIASLDRSGSFRESMENPMLSSLPNMSRSSSSATHGDVVNFFNYVHFDPKLVAADHKSNRQTDYKRHVSVALGISPDDSPSSSSKGKLLPSPVPDEIKRLKDSLHTGHVKARERGKMFSESLSVFHKVFPGITSKKRSRAEGFSNDRSSVMLSDRPVLGSSISKVGAQGHAVTGPFELEQQKSEERTKNLVPNKRTRTSLVDVRMDVRSNSLVRPSASVDREKEMLRIANSGAVQGEERPLPIGGDGWEKSKMKKKRSCIKLDGSPNTTVTKSVNIFQETKQGVQQRLVTDARSKLSSDSHSFRPGVPNGTAGAGKSDGLSQQTGMGIRASTPRNDQDNNSLVNERRGRPASSEKEKGNFRAVNKATVRDEFNSASPTSSTKVNAIRAPRSGSGVAPKLSPVVPRTAVPNDWEMSHCTTKPPAGVGTNNRKRVASARSSSPPVVPWQRPQKSSRTARRTNFMPIASNSDETCALEAVPDVAGNDGDGGPGFARRVVGSSQQIKLKGDPSSSAALSESEESGMGDIKLKEKSRKPEEVDQKAGKNIQKVSNLVLPTRKNKLVSGEEHGDGVRRQGRTGRGFTAPRSLVPMTSEKLGNIGTAKQLRSVRLEKNESRAGRPPTRKLSDRKAYARQKPSATNSAAEFLVGSEDGHEEQLAAVNAVINSAHASSSPFWKQLEPLFGLMPEEDITYWKQKENIESIPVSSTPVPSNTEGYETIGNGFGLNGYERDVGPDAQRWAGIITEQLHLSKDHKSIPLSERLIAALISEDDCSSGSEDVMFNVYDAEFEPDGELELSGLDHRLQANSQFACHSAYNGGHRIIGNPEHDESESDVTGIPSTGLNSSLGNYVNGLVHDKGSRSTSTCPELQYHSVDINNKLLLELQSIGIVLDPVPEMSQAGDEGILEDITRFEELYQEQVSKKKGLLDGLLKSASVSKESLEKDFEQRAMEKLIVMAYEKYVACPSGGRNSSNKMAKQAALGFVKRTLERCHQFEDTGKSCFNEPLFKDMFLAASSQLSVVRQLDGMEAESAKPYATPPCLDARTASMGSQQSPSQFSQNMDNHDLYSSDMIPAINHSSEQNSGKEDLWSNRVAKKRELSLDDVGGALGSSAPGIGNNLTSNAKGKRSERDRDGKGHSREVLSRNGTTKVGRPASSNAKGERKSKAKPKQKATQNSVSVNGLLGKLPEQPKHSGSKPNEIFVNNNPKDKDEFGLGGLDDHEPIDLSNLQLPGMDVLGVPDDLNDQGQDLGSWLNIDDDGLQDHDFVGLEIPLDDLSDLNMMV